MKLACFGAGEKSRELREKLRKYNDYEVKYYVEDSNFSKIGTVFDGCEVISVYTMEKMYQTGQIDGVLISTAYHKRTVQDMITACENRGLSQDDIYLVKINFIRGKEDEINPIVPFKELIQIFNLSIHVTDHCNLNCELCCHNAQFVEDEVFASLDVFQRDMQRMSSLVPNICNLALVGGEPLLHTELPGFLECARRYFPFANISLVTNGILLQGCSNELLDCIRRNSIGVDVSLYPPMHARLDQLLDFMRENRIAGEIRRVDRFFKKFCAEPQYDADEMSSYCGYCMGLRNGRISRCIDSFYTGYLNQKFGLDLPEVKGFDIYSAGMTPLELVHQLEKPIELCAYCANKLTQMELFEWKQLSEKVTLDQIVRTE